MNLLIAHFPAGKHDYNLCRVFTQPRPTYELATTDTYDFTSIQPYTADHSAVSEYIKLFALLFGMGFAVMLIRAREIGKPFGAWFTRRMLVLFVIGMLHMVFLWAGDILHDYAIAGLFFLGFILLLGKERFSKYDNPKSYLKLALIWLLFPVAISAIAGLGFGPYFSHEDLTNRWKQEKQVVSLVAIKMEESANIETNDAQLPEDGPGEEEQELEALTHGSYWEATRYRFFHALSALELAPALTFMMLLPIFVLGFWFVSSGVIRDHHNNAHTFRPMAVNDLYESATDESSRCRLKQCERATRKGSANRLCY